MADDNSTAPGAPQALPDPIGDLLAALRDIRGTVHVSREAVYGTMNPCDLQDHSQTAAVTLQAVEGALSLTEAAIGRVYEQLEAMSNDWPTQTVEVNHG